MDEVELRWLLPDGRVGGALPDGTVVRADRGLPGDRVRFEVHGHQGRTLDARVTERLVSSPDRRPAPCPWDAACGGCDLAELTPSARPGVLARMVARAFRTDLLPEVVSSPRGTAHRARIKLAIEGSRLGYRAARSHELVEIGRCGVAREEVQLAMSRVRDHLAALPPEHGLAAVELRSDGARVVFALRSATGEVPRSVRDGLATLGDVALDGRRLHGDPNLTLAVDGVALRASPNSFYQVNLEGNALLVEHVRTLATRVRAERAVDLYAGIGNLSLPLAAAGIPVVAVESEGQAVEDLRSATGALPVQVLRTRVERFDPSRTAFDLAVLDPPRAGAPGVLARLALNRPRAVVYVSCHAVSAARDLAELRGYRLTDLRCFDLFPDTRHVETVLMLERA